MIIMLLPEVQLFNESMESKDRKVHLQTLMLLLLLHYN